MRASLELRFSQKWTVESVGVGDDGDDEDDGEDGDDGDNYEDDVVLCSDSWVRQMKITYFSLFDKCQCWPANNMMKHISDLMEDGKKYQEILGRVMRAYFSDLME